MGVSSIPYSVPVSLLKSVTLSVRTPLRPYDIAYRYVGYRIEGPILSVTLRPPKNNVVTNVMKGVNVLASVMKIANPSFAPPSSR